MDRDGVDGFELLVVAVGGTAAVVVVGIWGGACLATLLAGSADLPPLSAAVDASARLPDQVAEPAAAWPPPHGDALPGPFAYWGSTVGAAVLVVAAVVALWRWLAPPRVGTVKRRPLGVDARSRFATRRDLTPILVTGPQPGRFIVAAFGRHFVATETTPTRRHQPKERRGDRGAVALIGPSRSGKTTAAIGGILDWDGPAVLSSVKTDLYAATVASRASLGDVSVFDPTGTTGVTTVAWSPLRHAGTITGAQRAARALCDAAPDSGIDGGGAFWLTQAEILLSSLLFIAHHTNCDMGTVCEWVLGVDQPTEQDPGEVEAWCEVLVNHDEAHVAEAAEAVARSLRSIWKMEERTRSSVYATAQTIVWPWSDPTVAASTRGTSITLDHILDGPNTLYLCAPIEDQKRLAPAFGGLLNDLIATAYRHVAATGQPLDPPLLIVIDEAGNTPLRALPEYASTLAGIGILLVTVWQSVAQIEAAYHHHADTILTNHLTKIFYAGLSDPATLRYIAAVTGDIETGTHSRSQGPGPTSIQAATAREPLAPPHALRQMRPGDSLLLHATLPPAHVHNRPYHCDNE